MDNEEAVLPQALFQQKPAFQLQNRYESHRWEKSEIFLDSKEEFISPFK